MVSLLRAAGNAYPIEKMIAEIGFVGGRCIPVIAHPIRVEPDLVDQLFAGIGSGGRTQQGLAVQIVQFAHPLCPDDRRRSAFLHENLFIIVIGITQTPPHGLTELRGALDHPPLLSGPVQCRQQQRSENRDDRNNDKKFNKSKLTGNGMPDCLYLHDLPFLPVGCYCSQS